MFSTFYTHFIEPLKSLGLTVAKSLVHYDRSESSLNTNESMKTHTSAALSELQAHIDTACLISSAAQSSLLRQNSSNGSPYTEILNGVSQYTRSIYASNCQHQSLNEQCAITFFEKSGIELGYHAEDKLNHYVEHTMHDLFPQSEDVHKQVTYFDLSNENEFLSSFKQNQRETDMLIAIKLLSDHASIHQMIEKLESELRYYPYQESLKTADERKKLYYAKQKRLHLSQTIHFKICTAFGEKKLDEGLERFFKKLTESHDGKQFLLSPAGQAWLNTETGQHWSMRDMGYIWSRASETEKMICQSVKHLFNSHVNARLAPIV